MLEINFWVVLYNLEPIWSDSNYWTKACVCSVYSLILNDSLVPNNLFRWSFWISITVENLPISQIVDSFITYNPCGNHIQYIVYHFFFWTIYNKVVGRMFFHRSREHKPAFIQTKLNQKWLLTNLSKKKTVKSRCVFQLNPRDFPNLVD